MRDCTFMARLRGFFNVFGAVSAWRGHQATLNLGANSREIGSWALVWSGHIGAKRVDHWDTFAEFAHGGRDFAFPPAVQPIIGQAGRPGSCVFS